MQKKPGPLLLVYFMNTALEYSTRVVQEGGRRCKKSTRFSTPDPSKNTFNEPAKRVKDVLNKSLFIFIKWQVSQSTCTVNGKVSKLESKGGNQRPNSWT